MKANLKKKYVQKASALNATSKKNGVFHVIATTEEDLDKENLQLEAVKCSHCSTEFATVKGLAPLCVTCNSDEVQVMPEDTQIEVVGEDKDLNAVTCGSCGTHNIISDNTLKQLSGHMHCVTCGEDMFFEQEQQDANDEQHQEQDQQEQDSDVDDVIDSIKTDEEQESSDEQHQEHDQQEQQAEGMDGEEQIEDDLEEETSDDLDEIEVDLEEEELSEDFDEQHQDEELSDDEEMVMQDDEQEQQADEVEDEAQDFPEVVEVSMLQLAPEGKFEVHHTGNAILAFVGGVNVARLTEEASGDNKPLFHNRSFLESIKVTASKMSPAKALANFGFEDIVVAFPQSKILQDKVQAAVEENKSKLETELSSLTDKFMQSLSIAAAGLNKGMFKNKEHVIKSALFEELSSLGIRSPSKIIDKVFASYSDAHHKTLLEIAMDMMSKSDEMRNELANTITDLNYQVAGDMDEEETQELDAGMTAEDDEEEVVIESRVQVASPLKIKESLKGKSLFNKR